DIGPAVAQKLDAFGSSAGVTGAVDDQVGAEPPDNVADAGNARLRGVVVLDVDRCLGAELAGELQPRTFGSADANHAPSAHLLRGGDGENADRAGALHHDRVTPFESAGANRAIKGADA